MSVNSEKVAALESGYSGKYNIAQIPEEYVGEQTEEHLEISNSKTAHTCAEEQRQYVVRTF